MPQVVAPVPAIVLAMFTFAVENVLVRVWPTVVPSPTVAAPEDVTVGAGWLGVPAG